MVTMLVTWRYDRSNAGVDRKAQELVAAHDGAGLPTPRSRKQVARVLGDDGGAVYDLAASGIKKGYLKTRLGVGGDLHYRPVKVDRRVLQGLALIVRVHCPDELKDVRRLEGGLRYDDVIGG